MPLRSPRLLTAVGVAAAATALGVAGHSSGWLPALEQDTVRARFALRDADPPRGITVVAIDPETFHRLDEISWPYPRSLHARAIDRLREGGARVIVYDVQFTEATTAREDTALFDSVQRAGNVILATSEVGDGGITNVLGGDDNVAAAGAEVGAANVVAGPGSVIERFPYSVGGLRSLAVVTVERDLAVTVDPAEFPGDGAWIDFRGGPGSVPTVSFADLLDGRFDRRLVRDRVVVVGAAVPTLPDLHPTPTTDGRLMSGAEIQAHAIETVRRGLPLRDAPAWLQLLLLGALGALPPLLAVRLPVIRIAIGCLLGFVGLLVGTQLAFNAGTVIDLTWTSVSLLTALGGIVLAGYAEANAHRNRFARANEELERRVRERTAELHHSNLEVVRRLAMAAEHRDVETGLHVERIGRMCHRLAVAAGLAQDDAERIGQAALLHDVGKIAVPDAVLRKPGLFTDEERRVMQTHAVAGSEILAGSRSALVREAELIARTHHERWDGSGYPNGLAGDEIPISGRICAICDVFDALVSERVYKPAMTLGAALDIIAEGRGTDFDPRLVDLFLPLAPDLYRDLHLGRPPETQPAPQHAAPA